MGEVKFQGKVVSSNQRNLQLKQLLAAVSGI
jgi:hypothetical protein